MANEGFFEPASWGMIPGGMEPETPRTMSRYVAPTTGSIGNGIGADREGGKRHHSGADFHAANGSYAVAVIGGQVIHVGNDTGKAGYGHYAIVQGDDGNMYRYATHGPVAVKVGQTIDQGSPIGTIARGHLHFEVAQPSDAGWKALKAGGETQWWGKNPRVTSDPLAVLGFGRAAPLVAGQAYAAGGIDQPAQIAQAPAAPVDSDAKGRDAAIRTAYAEDVNHPEQTLSVIYNRTQDKRYPSDPYGVVSQKSQFVAFNNKLAKSLSPKDPEYQRIGALWDSYNAGAKPANDAVNFYGKNGVTHLYGQVQPRDGGAERALAYAPEETAQKGPQPFDTKGLPGAEGGGFDITTPEGLAGLTQLADRVVSMSPAEIKAASESPGGIAQQVAEPKSDFGTRSPDLYESHTPVRGTGGLYPGFQESVPQALHGVAAAGQHLGASATGRLDLAPQVPSPRERPTHMDMAPQAHLDGGLPGYGAGMVGEAAPVVAEAPHLTRSIAAPGLSEAYSSHTAVPVMPGMHPIAPGPYGSDAVLKAYASNDPKAVLASPDIIRANASNDKLGILTKYGFGAEAGVKKEIGDYLQAAVINDPVLGQRIKQNIASNPALMASVPKEEAHKMMSALARVPAIKPVGEMPLPTERPAHEIVPEAHSDFGTRSPDLYSPKQDYVDGFRAQARTAPYRQEQDPNLFGPALRSHEGHPDFVSGPAYTYGGERPMVYPSGAGDIQEDHPGYREMAAAHEQPHEFMPTYPEMHVSSNTPNVFETAQHLPPPQAGYDPLSSVNIPHYTPPVVATLAPEPVAYAKSVDGVSFGGDEPGAVANNPEMMAMNHPLNGFAPPHEDGEVLPGVSVPMARRSMAQRPTAQAAGFVGSSNNMGYGSPHSQNWLASINAAHQAGLGSTPFAMLSGLQARGFSMPNFSSGSGGSNFAYQRGTGTAVDEQGHTYNTGTYVDSHGNEHSYDSG